MFSGGIEKQHRAVMGYGTAAFPQDCFTKSFLNFGRFPASEKGTTFI